MHYPGTPGRGSLGPAKTADGLSIQDTYTQRPGTLCSTPTTLCSTPTTLCIQDTYTQRPENFSAMGTWSMCVLADPHALDFPEGVTIPHPGHPQGVSPNPSGLSDAWRVPVGRPRLRAQHTPTHPVSWIQVKCSSAKGSRTRPRSQRPQGPATGAAQSRGDHAEEPARPRTSTCGDRSTYSEYLNQAAGKPIV